MKELLTEQEAAKVLHISTKSLQGWRYRGGGPRFVKLGRSVRYAMSDLEEYVLAAQRTSTSDRGRSPILLSQFRIRQREKHDQTGRALARAQAAASTSPTKPR
jgi:predicted DNA-binding transcriptional regulator AlpA